LASSPTLAATAGTAAASTPAARLLPASRYNWIRRQTGPGTGPARPGAARGPAEKPLAQITREPGTAQLEASRLGLATVNPETKFEVSKG